jgi:glucosyl-dolichyl phosphate glucuronosyltransferase
MRDCVPSAVSVIVPTYNRGAEVSYAIGSVLDQTASPDTYEVLVVDNNSTDQTGEIVDRLADEHPRRIRRIVERKQGVAYARQAGIEAARADILAFFDDDVRVARDWIDTIVRLFREHPDVDVLGGKVLPEWSAPPPQWLTPAHWAPLALQDLGDEAVFVSRENPRGLISANLACRKRVFERIGSFSPTFQRVKDGIGSLEDDEWIRRLWSTGGHALYAPELQTVTIVPPSRLTRAYHRRWHRGHGRFYAMLRADEIERSSFGSIFGVPAHLYRTAISDGIGLITASLKGRSEQAFLHETRLRFFRGFFQQRVSERLWGYPPVERHFS